MTEEFPLEAQDSDPLSPDALRYIGAAGHGALVGMLVLFVLLYRLKGSPYDATWQLVLAQVLSGRAGCAHLGMELGFSRYYLLFQICMHDFILMLYIYPWFARGYNQLARIRIVGPSLHRMREFMLRNKTSIAPYGILGLLALVCFPFWSVGPLVGLSFAYVIGMRASLAFAAAILGNIGAVAAWIWAYDKLQQYNKGVALSVLLFFFVLAAGWTICAHCRRARGVRGSAHVDR